MIYAAINVPNISDVRYMHFTVFEFN